MLILIDQSSLHSLILKIREEAVKLNEKVNYDKDKVVFMDGDMFDIFDEVDALMTPKKSFVYSIGSSSKLDERVLRYEAYCFLIEVFCDYFG